MAGHAVKDKKYIYYRCFKCNTYVREDQVEQALVKELCYLLEYNLALIESHIPVDNISAKKLNK